MFVDETTIEVTAGRGGDGVTSFHREKYKPRGGPDGGDGGRGGDVVLVADPGVGTLVEYHFHPHQRASRGAHGQGNNRKGADGDGRTLPVPLGTLVRDTDGELLADLDRPGARFLAARGGRGGRGNAALSGPGRRVAGFHEKGEPGRQRRLTLELRSLADAGLVGFPNAGKSSIVTRASAARPKVADYPFTTLEPVLGVVRAGDHDFVLADVPGLIPGAAAGKGLGHRFLRHVTRSAVLVHVLDLHPLEPGRDPEADLAALEAELAAYDPELADRPAMVVANKADLPEGRARIPEAEAAARRRGLPFFAVSAATGEGIRELLYALGAEVGQARAARPAASAAPPATDRRRPRGADLGDQGGPRVPGPGRPPRAVGRHDRPRQPPGRRLPPAPPAPGRGRRPPGHGRRRPGDEVLVGGAAFEFTPDPLADARAPGRRRGRMG